MLKVMIVDDEPLIRLAIRNLLDWEANGFKMLEGASNGAEAVDLLQKEVPDILFTDIKMPGMNGVDLIKFLEEKHPSVQTVVLSNYDDFSYVKEALMHGAVDYILKSGITPESLIQIIDSLKKKVVQKEDVAKEKLRKENEISKNFKWLKNEFLRSLVNGSTGSADEVEFNHQYYKTGLKDGAHLVCTLLADEEGETARKYEGGEEEILRDTVMSILEEIFCFRGLFFSYSYDRYVLILYMDSASENGFLRTVYEFVSRFQTTVHRYTNVSFTAGISGIKVRLHDLHGTYEESLQAAGYRFYMGTGKIFKYGDIAVREEDPGVKWLNKANIKMIKEALERRSLEVVYSMVQNCLEDIEQMHYDYAMVKQFLADYILFLRSALIEQTDHFSTGLVRSDKIYYSMNRLDTFKEVRQFTLEQIRKMEDCLKEEKSQGVSDIVGKTIEYIYRNYDKNITLISVAEFINVNASYLSRLFLQEIGKNFIDYLTEFRIRKAAKLLKESSLNVQEIGQKIGYHNPKYFNRVFKKVTGMSPARCRMESKNPCTKK